MLRRLFRLPGLCFCLASLAYGQSGWPSPRQNLAGGGGAPASFHVSGDLSVLSVDTDNSLPVATVALPRMAPELALQVCHGRAIVQGAQLSSYSAITLIHADLPDTHQSGEYELERHFQTPRQLTFKAVRFSGDNFVKSNVILRILQSEADHVQKDDPALNAISPTNYKFSYKGTTDLHGRLVHVYQLKPREKRAGLFKGRIYLDVYSGGMVRAEGKLVKSPSLFIKKLEFVQDYADVDSFTFPVHIHSEAQARIVGRVVVDITDSEYQAVSNVAQAKTSPTL